MNPKGLKDRLYISLCKTVYYQISTNLRATVSLMTGTYFQLEVNPVIPEALARLPELASDLVYSWLRSVRALFFRLDSDLWDACGHNPRLFLRYVSQEKLDRASTDLVYLQDYHRLLSEYDLYLAKQVSPEVHRHIDPQRDLIAYFCAEFGLHESVPIYSGGLGILAGDYCKAAADLGLPFVGVGLFYRVGYFTQTIDAHGQQQMVNTPLDDHSLPISPVLDAGGAPLVVSVDLPGRKVALRIWSLRIAKVRLYLLDTDVVGNSEHDRQISYQLYGGDMHMRIQQEIMLGIGGVRALRAMGLHPTIWHINEGHAAFLILERCREHVQTGHQFSTALELVAAATVFTTHTPVPAGHDIFPLALMREYFQDYLAGLGVAETDFMALGASTNTLQGFNQTALALRGSRAHNGVSRIHGGVASRMEAYVWPEIPPAENPIGFITNGIHVPTFLSSVWVDLFDSRFGRQWRNELLNPAFWEMIDDLPGSTFWSVRQLLKYDLIKEIRRRIGLQARRNELSDGQIARLTRFLIPGEDVLLIGFARRFATYKRATLLFEEPQRLARLLSDPARPVCVIFAGKAHPKDHPGQELIKSIYEYSLRPEFEGRIVLLEGYDIALARHMVTGVDVWLNTPEYPLEASGYSGHESSDQWSPESQRAGRLVGGGLSMRGRRGKRLGYRAASARPARRTTSGGPCRFRYPGAPDPALIFLAQWTRLFRGLGATRQKLHENPAATL